jgi:rfaE bifunctional protein kinase chain/domain
LRIERLKELEENFSDKKIIVVGDMMLDGYFWGDVTRVSPEAPVPIVEVDNEFFKFGGAANVALNILKLGGIPIPVGVIGNDLDATTFTKLMNDENISAEGIFKDPLRPTTTKTRVIAGKQHIVRIDKEKKDNISEQLENKILNFIASELRDSDGIILQDYNKGVLTEKLINSIIDLATKNNKIISVDPKFINFKNFQNVTIFKPNKKETEDILGLRINTDQDISKAGNELLKLINSKYVLLTLGEKGIALFEEGKIETRIPTKARKVADVSGAGDTVISTITYALACGSSIEEAAYIANYAGGIVCEEIGIVPIDKEKLFSTVYDELT